MITRHFIDIVTNGTKRRVHYRVAGVGPPLLMVHQSPRSSKEYEPLMQKWASHFTCIAPDTPGFGQSDSLHGRPEIDEYADALVEFLDTLGVKKCAAYGFHSGGIILVSALKRHANRFTTLAIGGYAIWTPEEQKLFGEKYLPEFHPSKYGEHLIWLWNRILEQTWFFPWFAADDNHRLSVANDDPQRIDLIVREMLYAGNAYQAGYGAVLRAANDIPAVNADVPPCLISAYDGDPLQAHLDRLGTMPSSWSTRKFATPEEHQTASLAHLRQSETPEAAHLNETQDEGFIHIETKLFNGLLHWHGDRGADRLQLHAPGQDSGCNNEDGRAIHIDLPGHGLSDDWMDDAPTDWQSWQAVVNACLYHFDASESIFPALPKGDPEKLYPDLSPDRFGNYLTIAWQIARARRLFEPWYEANAAHALSFAPESLAPDQLALDHLALLNARSAKAYHLALESRS
ncbi:alpha/beta fold hydrolase [uncultured Parasphingorhabdus sp.]|uniref:alpha/beta hydrolase n=1 Tax=uncultured Parasphingorhabdus sp. TaxID=2709694 RepID=UPI002AA7EB2D|nr:alpha/beta fold hydrolase [uncultured Parasphingorhabdus sp.]